MSHAQMMADTSRLVTMSMSFCFFTTQNHKATIRCRCNLPAKKIYQLTYTKYAFQACHASFSAFYMTGRPDHLASDSAAHRAHVALKKYSVY